MKKDLLIGMLMAVTLMVSPLGYAVVPVQAEVSTLREVTPENYHLF